MNIKNKKVLEDEDKKALDEKTTNEESIEELIDKIIDKEDNILEKEISKLLVEKELLLEEKDALEKETTSLMNKLQRSMAEFDNFRKRTDKEKTQMYDDGVIDTVEKLLPIWDNFERAVVTFENKDDAVYKGFELILKQLDSYFKEIGIVKIDAIGQQFDTNYHSAVAHVNDDNYSDNEIVEEIQKGFTYKEKVIRFSMVKVAN